MALTTDQWNATELVAYISEEWPGPTNEEFFSEAVALRFFRDLTPFAQGGSDIFHIPNVFTNSFSVQTQTTQGVEVTTDAPTTVDDKLTVDTHQYIATLLGYKDQQQINSNYDLGSIYSRKAGGTLLEKFESTMFGNYTSLSTNTVGDTSSPINDADIRQAVEKLHTADVPLNEVAFFYHPYSYWVQVLGIQKYYDASQFGGMSSATARGVLGGADAPSQANGGTLFGIPVFISSQITNTLLAVRNILAHKDTFAFAFQTPGGAPIDFRSADWLENLGILAVWQMIYGTAEMREEAAVLLNSSNAFIVS